MLYTTYFSKIKQIPDNVKKLIITRFPPKWFDVNKYPNTYIVKEFAPYAETLLQYKKDNNWNTYVENFTKQMQEDEKMIVYLEKLESKLLDGKDYALICYERNYIYCHRYLIAKYLESKGIEWKEI